MSFYKLLRSKLEKKLPESALEKLPRSYNMLGKILVLKLQPDLENYKKEIGCAVLELLPVKTVCLLKEIREETRKPEVEVIAGNGTETLHREHRCVYKIDVAKFMFSKGNKAEKLRIVEQVKQGEIIVDMFAGIGYFTIPLAKLTGAGKIYAIDINPEAITYLKENIKLNKVEHKVIALCGDCRNICLKLADKGVKADRVLMGYLFNTYEFFDSALKVSKKGTIIHFHFLAKENEVEKILEILKEIAKENKRSIRIKFVKKVKSYAPKIWHYVADILVK